MITASALAPNCAFAKVLGAKKRRTPEQQASIDKGNDFHRAAEVWIASGVLPIVEDAELQGWLDELASKFWPPHLTNAETEVAWGLWDDGTYAEVTEPAPHVYHATRPNEPHRLITAGRADLGYLAGNVLEVIDWKTGRWPSPAAAENLQVNAAGIALAQRLFVPWYRPGVYYPRDGHFDWGDPVEVGGRVYADMVERVLAAASLPLEPRPGDWCGSCWERRACPQAQLR
jgi:hypothetical protein